MDGLVSFGDRPDTLGLARKLSSFDRLRIPSRRILWGAPVVPIAADLLRQLPRSDIDFVYVRGPGFENIKFGAA
jgi:hypothetical protein